MRLPRAPKGQATVELAIILPLVLLFIFCLMQIVMLFKTKFLVDYAAYMGARSACVHYEDPQWIAHQAAAGVMRSSYPFLSANWVKVPFATASLATPNFYGVNVDIIYYEPLVFPLVDRVILLNSDPAKINIWGKPALPFHSSWSMPMEMFR